MTYMRDAFGSRLDSLDPLRDLPQIVGWWDFSTLTGTDGTTIRRQADKSGFGHSLIQNNAAVLPTKQTGEDGKPVARFASNAYLACTQLGAVWPSGKAFGPPVTIVVVAKVSSTQVAASFPLIAGGIATGGDTGLFVQQATGSAFASTAVGAVGAGQGTMVTDDTWHVIVGTADIAGASTYIDGYLTGTTSATTASTGLGSFVVGAKSVGANPTNMDVREVLVLAGRLRFDQVEAITAALAARAPGSITTGKCRAGSTPEDPSTNQPNGQACRIWEPHTPTTPKTLVLWAHPSGANQFVSPGVWNYPLFHAALAQGWYVAASIMHGTDSWGNSVAVADLLDLYNMMTTRYGAFTKVVLLGASMGGLASLLAVASGTIPNLVGAFLIDPVCSLANMYASSSYTGVIDTAYGITRGILSAAITAGATSIPTTASYPTTGTQLLIGNGTANVETVTTTGPSTGTAVPVAATTKAHASAEQVSDYSTKTAGRDPLLLSASSFATRLHFTASNGDTTVVKTANTDPFRTLVATTAVESALTARLGVHLAGAANNPADFIAFAKRAIGVS